ncbi:uncharacterized protein K452DRAFT_271190, partial [Aplosporella prunicola CBS 121167]
PPPLHSPRLYPFPRPPNFNLLPPKHIHDAPTALHARLRAPDPRLRRPRHPPHHHARLHHRPLPGLYIREKSHYNRPPRLQPSDPHPHRHTHLHHLVPPRARQKARPLSRLHKRGHRPLTARIRSNIHARNNRALPLPKRTDFRAFTGSRPVRLRYLQHCDGALVPVQRVRAAAERVGDDEKRFLRLWAWALGSGLWEWGRRLCLRGCGGGGRV